jgi:aminoglycoside phosphotransferase (APT) family kinase protein/O-antigen/teichoic acid export membrane protein
MSITLPVRRTASPLLRNGYALVANTLGTAGIGAIFWLLAARLYSLEDVGVNAALISAMTFLSKLGQLNMTNALNRFVPSAGVHTGRFIAASYAVCALTAGAAATIFVFGVGIWSPGLSMIRDSATMFAGFVLATMAWTVFVLQDAALTGLRRATWVPVENFAYGLAKVAGLVVLATVAPGTGIFLAWTLPLVILLIVVNRLAFTRVVSEHASRAGDTDPTFDPRAIVRFAGADFLGSLGWVVIVDLLPVVVFSLAGAEANAYFFLAWTIAYTLYLIGRGTGMSLITEGSLDPSRLHTYARRVLSGTLLIILPIAAGMIAFAPLVLGFFGADYAREGSTVLRLLVLSSLPAAVIAVYAAVARVERRLLAMGLVHGVLGMLVVALSVGLIGHLGVAGVGWACLGAMTAVAGFLLLTNMRHLWMPAALEHPVSRSLLARLQRVGSHNAANSADDALETVLAALVESTGETHRIVERLATDPGVAAAIVRSTRQQTDAILKVPDRSATPAVLHEAAALIALHDEPELSDWRGITPRLLVAETTGRPYTVQAYLPGVDGRTATSLGLDLGQATLRTAEAISDLHHRTTTATLATAPMVERLVGGPLDVTVSRARGLSSSRHRASIDRLRARLVSEIADRSVRTAWTHGDLWLGNVLFGFGGEVTGIVDWGGWNRTGIPGMDLAHLVLTTRMLRTGSSLGTVMCAYLDDPTLSDAEQQVLDLASGTAGDPAPPEPILFLLAWLHHLASNLAKSSRYETSWLWSTRNVEPVLASL